MAALSPERFLALLAKGKPVPGIFLLGGESYLREVCRKKIIDAYVPEGVRDWGITRFSAEDDELSAILGQAQTLPMLAKQQVIFVSDVEAWERLGEESRDTLVKELSAYLENPAPFSILVFEASALDQRMRLAKTLMEKTVTVSVELSSDPAQRVKRLRKPPMAFEMARELRSRAGTEAAEELAEIPPTANSASIRTWNSRNWPPTRAIAGKSRRRRRRSTWLCRPANMRYGNWRTCWPRVSRLARWNFSTASCAKGSLCLNCLARWRGRSASCSRRKNCPQTPPLLAGRQPPQDSSAGGGAGGASIAKILRGHSCGPKEAQKLCTRRIAG